VAVIECINQVVLIECINQVVLIECINCYAYKYMLQFL